MPIKEKLKIGDWVIWYGDVCQILDTDEHISSIRAIVFDSTVFDSTFKIFVTMLEREATLISEEEAVFLLLKNKAFIDNP